MKIGLLQCDDVAESLIGRHGNYPDMIEAWLKGADPNVQMRRWACHQGQLPASIDDADAWITTGSKCSAYDDTGWIHELADFMRRLWHGQRRLVGICFGHQLIAQALGGRVELSPRGWGIGMYGNTVDQPQPWMTPWQGEQLNLLASHQDQVAVLPPAGTLLAHSTFCPIYMMQVGDTFLGIQGHPEFSKAYSADLMALRRDTMGPECVDAGMNSLTSPLDAGLVARWVLNFMRGS